MKRTVLLLAACGALALTAREWPGFTVGMGMGGWLTNYKRFNVLPENKRLHITKGDLAQTKATIEAFARVEGLDAHGRAATIRFEGPQ